MKKSIKMNRFIQKTWHNVPKEIKVAGYIGVSAGVWGFIKTLGVEYEGNTLAVAIINLLIVLIQTRLPQIRESVIRKK